MAKKKHFDHHASRFLDEWADGGVKSNPNDLPKHTVKHDKWDEADYNRLLKEMQELSVAEDRITEVIDTGGSLFGDTYFSLSKADPHLKDPGEVRPSHLVNRAVMGEAIDMAEWEKLRQYSVGDEIGAALATIAMEPDLETLYDKLKQEQKMAEQLAKQAAEVEQQQKSVDELMKELENLDPDDPDYEEAAKNFQDNKAMLNEMMQRLAEGASDLQARLDKAGPAMRAAIRAALQSGLDEVESTEACATAWGLDRGTLQRLPAAERIELAKRLHNPRLKRIAELIGPMSRLAFAEQMRKTTHARDEVYDLSMGSDLARVLPMELANIRHPVRKFDFMRRLLEGQLLQYELRGQERVAKGGIICCEDGSGSMHGDREMWAKAVSICLLHLAKAQERSFFGIHFGSPGELYPYDFRTPSDITFERVMDWAEVFCGGGTDFMSPLSKAMDLLVEEYELKGAVSGDIVFITDGQCGVSDDWLKAFKEEQARIGFRIFGIVIGGSPKDEPLYTITDGRTLTVKDLTSGDDLRDIFRAL